MPSQFYPIDVKSVKSETENAVSIFFDIPAELRDVFRYKAGQYVTLRLTIDGKTFNRAYSLGSSPAVDESLFITVKKTEYGFVSSYLAENVQPGNTIYLLPPLGNFTVDFSSDNSRLFILFGGGSGITPLFSIIKTALLREPESRMILFYANRDDRSIIYDKDLNHLSATSGGRLRVLHSLSEPSNNISAITGQITPAQVRTLLAEHIPDEIRAAHYFICGPTGMMQLVEDVLAAENVPGSQIHREQFLAQHDASEAPPAPPKERNINVRLYGREYNISVATGATILEAAIDQNLDPPYACQIAACCTCRAKLINGKVQMDNREALTDEELDEGYILTCQSHPLTDDVLVDYDQ
ncbi:phenylacetate-CoA oxygenase/reductase subunit PaaK [Ignavibacteria bacterium]|nr:ferredoxin--NADP reductase [Bacteroidota bacterium]MCZ2133760.1 ferredoxin--NADP reductase [Bacteroidota bacterium]